MSDTAKQIVFVKAETMLASLSARPSWGRAANKIQEAYVLEDDDVKYFPYTHSAEIASDASDEDAVRAALGKQTKYWGNTRLKVLRVSEENVVSEFIVDTTQHTPCPANQKYFNYVECNMLHLPEADKNVLWSHDPNPKPRGLEDLELTA
ncbi:MAG: hypothetical protein AAF244_00795 [Pseudomonadota bacterium]